MHGVHPRLWNYQIYQHTGDFSRHTGWNLPNPDEATGWHAGVYIAIWAYAYEHTHDPGFEKAIITQLDLARFGIRT